ncbi:hypothetical protein [Pandoraea sputorum]|uniref:Uncharacterized protein n=1 Tax=Pandoraea sputorum TaxID=93222 RepID=A0A5E5BFJ4_9BURK|nr:hypothetical protein [Pandoraea sputorum]VVE84931.1 hypothetical protein PSP31121_05000 [Pandoraea sputorum]
MRDPIFVDGYKLIMLAVGVPGNVAGRVDGYVGSALITRDDRAPVEGNAGTIHSEELRPAPDELFATEDAALDEAERWGRNRILGYRAY